MPSSGEKCKYLPPVTAYACKVTGKHQHLLAEYMEIQNLVMKKCKQTCKPSITLDASCSYRRPPLSQLSSQGATTLTPHQSIYILRRHTRRTFGSALVSDTLQPPSDPRHARSIQQAGATNRVLFFWLHCTLNLAASTAVNPTSPACITTRPTPETSGLFHLEERRCRITLGTTVNPK